MASGSRVCVSESLFSIVSFLACWSLLLFEFTSLSFFTNPGELFVESVIDLSSWSLHSEDDMFSVFGEAVIGSVDVEELELSLMVFFLKSTQLGGGLSLSPPDDGRSNDAAKLRLK